ncbi:Radical SAM domain protein [Candidatus Sulfobium mesophilum]|uniref:Radical SAM domain protein n=1 Tax=Candidatus Sulfobium mesophilum TaxID=2016548 RepID=A0A2U3QEM3_9BACT|nr:Radical SAM domain protein [Candidatus Sulfobium mesophilum]
MKTNNFLKAPLTINWAVTNRCNFKCRHCYSRTDPTQELDSGTLFACIEKVISAGVLSVNFGGGEPLLRNELLEISAFSADRGLRVSMNSNGYLIDRKRALDLKAAGFSKVGISLDSHVPEVHDNFRGIRGSHKKAISALTHLAGAGIKTSISTVICKINHQSIEELTEFAGRHGVHQLNFHNFKCSGLGYSNKDELDLSSQEWKEFYIKAMKTKQEVKGLEISLDDPIIASLGMKTETDSFVKGSVCGKLSLNIKSNGDITPCGFIPIVIGNIVSDELKQIWDKSPVLERMRNKKPTGKCSSCKSYEDCLGGCSARALALTGDFNNPDPHCWVHEP